MVAVRSGPSTARYASADPGGSCRPWLAVASAARPSRMLADDDSQRWPAPLFDRRAPAVMAGTE